MRLANLHHSNIGGLLLEAFYSHQHSWWFIVAKAPTKPPRASGAGRQPAYDRLQVVARKIRIRGRHGNVFPVSAG